MDIFNNEKSHFRYYILTTEDKSIHVYFHFSPEEIDDLTPTIIEHGHLQLLKNPTNVIKMTTPYNIFRVDEFNNKICDYIKTAKFEINEIRIICTSHDLKLIFEPKIFKTMSDCCGKLYFDLKDCAVRVTDDDYKQIKRVEIFTGTLFADKPSIIYIDEFIGGQIIMDVFNKFENDCTINISTTKKFEILNLRLYSTLKLVLLCQSKDGTEFKDSKCGICNMVVFGEEFQQVDKTSERILVKGFNKVFFDYIFIESPVKYSTIIRADLVTELTVGRFIRKILEITPGPQFKIGRNAKFNFHKSDIEIMNNSTILENESLVLMERDESGLTKKVNIFESKIVNNNGLNINFIKSNSNKIESIYVTKSHIGENVKMLNFVNTTISKLNINLSNIKTNNDFTLVEVEKVSIVDTDINTKKNIVLGGKYISINGGTWEFADLVISNKDFLKVVLTKLEAIGVNITIKSTEAELVRNCFFYEGKYRISNKILISGLKPSLVNTYIKTGSLTMENEENVQFNDTKLDIFGSVLNINIKASVTGLFSIAGTDGDSKVNIDVDDDYEFLSMNPIIINNGNPSINPTFTFNINRPMKIEMNNIKSSATHVKFKPNYNSEVATTVIINHNETRVICDSEKTTSINGPTKEPEFGRYEYVLKLK